jgi:hypothetical protein
LVVLQNLAERRQQSEICPSSSRDEDEATDEIDEVFLDAEDGEYPVANTSAGVEAEPEVSLCLLGGFRKYRYPSFYKLYYSEQPTFITVPFFFCLYIREMCTQHGTGVEKQTSATSLSHHPSL